MEKQSLPQFKSPLIETKLHPPRHAGALVERPRLIDLFSLGRFRKLTLVQAPAGFGKTTLVSQWRRDLICLKRKVAWLSVDEDDNEFTRFFSYVIAAFQVVHPKICQGAQVLLQVGASVPEEAVISMMINELMMVEQHTLLIIDDYHVIRGPAVNRALKQFIDYLPDHIHLIIAGRSEPGFRLVDLKIKAQLYEVNADDLRFTAEESHVLLNEKNKLNLKKKEVHKLHNLCQGWAAGLQLSAISLQGRKDTSSFIDSFSGSFQMVKEYLSVDVLDSQPGHIIDFLLKTSILNRFTPDLANQVVGITNSSEILKELEQANLFIQRLDEKKNWYCYHQVFGQFLRDRLEKTMPDQVLPLHQAACKWFADKDFSFEAVQHALSADDIPRAAELIEECAMLLVFNGQLITLIQLMNKLPPSHWENSVRIQLALSWAYVLTNQFDESEKILDVVEKKLNPKSDQKDERLDYMEARMIRAGLYLFRCDYMRAENEASFCRQLATNGESNLLGLTGNMLTYAYYHLGRLNQAWETQKWASEVLRTSDNNYGILYSRVLPGILEATQGHLEQAQKKHQKAYEMAIKAAGPTSIPAALPAAFLFNLLYEFNDMTKAGQLLDNNLDLIDIGSISDALVDCCVPRALWLFSTGQSPQARALLDRLEQVGHKRKCRFLLAEVMHVNVRIATTQKQYRRAQDLLARHWEACKSAELSSQHTDLIAGIVEETTQARVMMVKGETQEACSLLSNLINETTTFGFIRRSVGLTVLLAVAQNLEEDKQKALKTLCRALVQAQSMNMIRTFIDEGKPVQKMLEILEASWDDNGMASIRSNAQRIFVEQLLASFCSSPSSIKNSHLEPDIVKDMPEPLSDREQEILEILSSGVTNKEIAEMLSITIHTVKYHLVNIYGKLGVINRTEAVNEARLMGLLKS